MHLGLEPTSKHVSSVVGSIGQIRVGITGFTVNLEREKCRSCRIDHSYLEVEEAHFSVLIMDESRWVCGVYRRWRALPFQLYIVVSGSELSTETT